MHNYSLLKSLNLKFQTTINMFLVNLSQKIHMQLKQYAAQFFQYIYNPVANTKQCTIGWLILGIEILYTGPSAKKLVLQSLFFTFICFTFASGNHQNTFYCSPPHSMKAVSQTLPAYIFITPSINNFWQIFIKKASLQQQHFIPSG